MRRATSADRTAIRPGADATRLMVRPSMRYAFGLFGAWFCASALALPWPAAAQDDLHRYLDAAYRQGMLVGNDAAPFHLTARIDLFQDNGHDLAGTAALDEIWRDPLHWKLAMMAAGRTFTEIDD